MINITLKNGDIKQIASGISIADFTKELSMGLFRAACCAEIDSQTADLRTELNKDCSLSILTFDDDAGKKTFWHTASHILAQAIKRLFPNTKLAIGPAIDNGFYYDFDVPSPFSAEDLLAIEKEMKKIVKENLLIKKFTLSADEAIKLMQEKNEPYKIELINEHKDKGEDISFYSQGEFSDLCAGPHLMSTGTIKAFKLTQTTGAYWRGDSNNRQLCRVYGTAFPKAAQLEEHLKAVEEAKKRDHNIIGRKLNFFTTVDTVGQGLPLIMPKGAKVLQILQRFVEDEEEKRGYLLTKTPFMAKNDLYKLSGHWDHYKNGMFILGDEEKEDEIFALRPMTCPFQFMIYNNSLHSYRDLPIRYNETSTLFRNESSGEMHGLIRVRQFTLSEGHLIVTPEQLADEFAGVIDLINYMMETLGIKESITFRFSKRDPADKEKYVDDDASWDSTEARMKDILDDLKIPYTVAIGEAAFYGPKLDLQFKNVHGKEDTLITVQIDFCLGERLSMVYVDKDGEKKHPMIIHRSSIGCYERTLAMLIEKHAGALPLWMSPEQVRILPISEHQHEYCQKLKDSLSSYGIRVTLDSRNEKIGYKIRESQMEKIPYMLVIGDKEKDSGDVAVRSRKDGDIGTMSVDDFISLAQKEIAAKA